MNGHDEELPVATFFEKDQAIGLIARINREHGNIKAELADEVDLSGKVLKRLLDDAKSADLIEEVSIRAGDHPRSTRYQLSNRGKAVQSVLRGMGLDEVQRDYMDSKQKLEDAVPDVQSIIYEDGLHKKYIQQDHWTRTNSAAAERDREKILADMDQEDQADKETSKSLHPEDSETDVNPVTDEDSLQPKEVWGTPSDEDEEK